jgi:hypothetical protein
MAFVPWRVLDNAHRIYPQILEAEIFGLHGRRLLGFVVIGLC